MGSSSLQSTTLATVNGVTDGRSNWLVAPPTLHRAVPPELHVLHTAMRALLQITRLTALSERRTCDLRNTKPTHCLCGHSGRMEWWLHRGGYGMLYHLKWCMEWWLPRGDYGMLYRMKWCMEWWLHKGGYGMLYHLKWCIEWWLHRGGYGMLYDLKWCMEWWLYTGEIMVCCITWNDPWSEGYTGKRKFNVCIRHLYIYSKGKI